MWKKLLTLFLLAALLGCTLSRSVLELQETSEELTQPSAVQVNQARRSSSSVTKSEKVKAAATTTTTAPETSTTSPTQRPLIVKYWNNLVERVRSPFSNFTNPLVNLFNDGTSNQVIETPILEYNIEDTTAPKRRRKSGSKRKSAHSTRHRYQAYDLPVNELDYEYDYQQQPQLQYYDQQTIVPAPPARQVYYFYDPNMRRYYGLQAVQPNDYYATQPAQYQHYTKLRKPQPAYYYTEDEYRPSYYRPISSQSHSHRRRRPTSHKQRPKPMRVTVPTTQTIEEPLDEVPTMYEEEQMELAQMQEMQENSQVEQQMQEEAYMPAEGVDVVENFDDEEDEFRKLQGTPELIDTAKEDDEEPEVEVEDTEAKEEAMLRNALGSFMSDDSLNRQRQRSHAKENTKKAKQTPRYQYYLLRNW